VRGVAEAATDRCPVCGRASPEPLAGNVPSSTEELVTVAGKPADGEEELLAPLPVAAAACAETDAADGTLCGRVAETELDAVGTVAANKTSDAPSRESKSGLVEAVPAAPETTALPVTDATPAERMLAGPAAGTLTGW